VEGWKEKLKKFKNVRRLKDYLTFSRVYNIVYQYIYFSNHGNKFLYYYTSLIEATMVNKFEREALDHTLRD